MRAIDRSPSSGRGRFRPCLRLRLAVLTLVLGSGLTLTSPAPALSASSETTQDQGFAQVVKKVLPAVVSISVRTTPEPGDEQRTGEAVTPNNPGTADSPFEEFLRKFFEDQGTTPRSTPAVRQTILGSGFITDPRGFIVTNNHVVTDAGKVTVIFQDDSKHAAKVVGRDPKTDLALLKIETERAVPFVVWGDSDATQVGDWVIAVGNAFGLGGTVSAGIISARGRDIHAGPYDDFLQIDAPINRGDSGGPTFNREGEVIGVNTAIYSPSGGSVGVGFAIPSNRARPVIEQLMAYGKVSRGWLGVQTQALTPAIARYLGLASAHGALVGDVAKGGPADKAGIQQGDVITTFAGEEIVRLRDLTRIIADTTVGQTVKIKVWRKDHEVSLEATIVRQPERNEAAAGGSATQQRASFLGMVLSVLTPELRRLLGGTAPANGVVVTQIQAWSPFATIDLQPGDVIVSINEEPVSTPQDAVAKLESAQSNPERGILFQLNRQGTNLYVGWSEQDNGG